MRATEGLNDANMDSSELSDEAEARLRFGGDQGDLGKNDKFDVLNKQTTVSGFF
jgi:hypothetical protein